eukprot:1273238-Rhodomonas_salina.1
MERERNADKGRERERDLGVLDGAADDHDGVVDRALRLRDELLRSCAAQHQSQGQTRHCVTFITFSLSRAPTG